MNESDLIKHLELRLKELKENEVGNEAQLAYGDGRYSAFEEILELLKRNTRS